MYRLLIACLATLLLSGQAFAADTTADVQKTLQAYYADRDAAFTQKNIDATLARYAPDFVGVGAAGKTHDLKEERADFLHTFALPSKSAVTKSTIDKLTLSKGGSEVLVTLHKHAVLLFADPQSGQNNVLMLDVSVTDTWAKRPSGWRLTREQSAPIKATMNGKPL